MYKIYKIFTYRLIRIPYAYTFTLMNIKKKKMIDVQTMKYVW